MAYEKEQLQVYPYFDLESFLSMLQETRIGGQVIEDLAKAWENFSSHLHALKLQIGKDSYLIIWLDEEVENEIDALWAKSPSEGFRLNVLAQNLCMNAVYQLLPEVEEAGCAPAPKPTKELEDALAAEGIPYSLGGPGLSRKYSVLTYGKFRGACDICHLKMECPKALAKGDSFHSVELPGFE